MKAIVLTVLAFQVVSSDWSLEPKEVNYIYKRSECNEFNRKFIGNLNCSHTFRRNFSKYSSFEFTVHPGVMLDKIYLELTTYKQFRTVFRPTLIKVKENFCDIVSNKSNSYLARELRKQMAKYVTNLNEPCPLKGRKYKRDNMELKDAVEQGGLPPIIPIGDWKFSYRFTTLMNGPEELILQISDVFEVTQKSATQF